MKTQSVGPAATAAMVLFALVSPGPLVLPAHAARETGIDVSQFQTNSAHPFIDWNAVKGSGKTFAFCRATRGGSDSGNTAVSGFLNDPTFAYNIVAGKEAGVLMSPYHVAKLDTPLLNGSIVDDATDEALHFLSIAGPYMSDGYLRPALDMELGGANVSQAQMGQWINTFCATIVAAKGPAADPIIYTTSSYAYNEMDTSVNVHALWLARWNAGSFDPHSAEPAQVGGQANPYGVWNSPGRFSTTTQVPGPWAFWQYTSSGACPGIDPSVNTVDLDVFHSDTMSISAFVVPEPATVTLLPAVALLLRPRVSRCSGAHQSP